MNDDHSAQPTQLYALVTGQVQGVGFRAFVQKQADTLGVKGWVRNTYDGDVELVAEGDRPVLERLLLSLRTGPRGAYVVDVRPQWREASGEFTRFQVRPTV